MTDTSPLRISYASQMRRPDLTQLDPAALPPLKILTIPSGHSEAESSHLFVTPLRRPSFSDRNLTLWSGSAMAPGSAPQHVADAVAAFNANLGPSWLQLLGDYARYELAEYRRQLAQVQEREQEAARYLADLTALQAATA